MEPSYKQFIITATGRDKSRVHKVTHSLGVYDAYKYIRKNKWFNIGRPLTEKEFYSIIRTVNKYLAEELLHCKDIVFPHKMGKLELRKSETKTMVENGKIKTSRPIDWNKTLQLWYEDKDSFNKKQLVYCEVDEVFKVNYAKFHADYVNQTFMTFSLNRDLKIKLKEQIKKNKIDAFKIY